MSVGGNRQGRIAGAQLTQNLLSNPFQILRLHGVAGLYQLPVTASSSSYWTVTLSKVHVAVPVVLWLVTPRPINTLAPIPTVPPPTTAHLPPPPPPYPLNT